MNIQSIESLYATIEQQQRVIKQAHEDIVKLTAERDAALAALREAKEALIKNIVGTGGRTPAAHNAIATINKVLGEE